MKINTEIFIIEFIIAVVVVWFAYGNVDSLGKIRYSIGVVREDTRSS